MTDHTWFREHIDPYVCGGLDAAERGEFESHLGDCEVCAAELETVLKSDAVLLDAFRGAVPDGGLEDRLVAGMSRRRVIPFPPALRRIVTGVAAVILLGVVGFVAETAVNAPQDEAVIVVAPSEDWLPLSPHKKVMLNYSVTKAEPESPDVMARTRNAEMLAYFNEESETNKDYASMEKSLTPAEPPADPAWKRADDLYREADEEYESMRGDSTDFKTDKPFSGSGLNDLIGAGGGGAHMRLAREAERIDLYTFQNNAPSGGGATFFQPGMLAQPEPPKPEVKAAEEQPTRAPAKKPPTQDAQETPTIQRKVIRNGEMEFEIDGFDAALMQITKIVGEEGGYVSSTNSEKLANGKMRGTIVVRCPPERLDVLVMKLRALGDLKSQRISDQDVTKHYTDIESQLRAARAMEERLIQIIKTGKGEIKDLLEAEKQLGEYREKIERLEGEIRYYNNLISLSTLSITLYERDIRTPSSATETEVVDMGVEVDDVTGAYQKALDAIAEAKGRVTQSDLKQYEAGQYAATIGFEVKPDVAGALRDRLGMLGRTARLDVQRRQTTAGGTGAPTVNVERLDTRFNLSLYNVANVAPRLTVQMNLAAADVEAAFKAVIERIGKAEGARVVTSNLNRQNPEQTTGSIHFEVRSADADAVLADVRGQGEVMQMNVVENPDARNVTTAKRGFTISIYALAQVAPRETTSMSLAADDVGAAFRALAAAIRESAGRILVSQLNENDPTNVTAALDFEVTRERLGAIETALAAAGESFSRNVARASDVANTVDSKVRFSVQLYGFRAMTAGQTVAIDLAARDVADAFAKLQQAVDTAEGHVLVSKLEEQDRNNMTGVLEFAIRAARHDAVDHSIVALGDVVSKRVNRAAQSQGVLASKVSIRVNITGADQLPPRETTIMGIEVDDVKKTHGDLLAFGKTVDSSLSIDRNGRAIGKVVFDVPLAEAPGMLSRLSGLGHVRVAESAKDPRVPGGALARARFEVTLGSADALVPAEDGLGATLKEGFGTSLKWLIVTVNFVIVGVIVVGPWAAIGYGGWRIYKRRRATA